MFSVFIAIFIILKIPFIKKAYEKLLEKLAMKIIGKSNHENLITLLDNYGRESIAEVVINALPKFMQEKYLYELNLRENYKLNVLSLRRKGRVVAVYKNTMLQEGDVLILFGLHQSIIDLFKKENDTEQEPELKFDNSLELVDNFGKEAMVRVKIAKVPEMLKNKTLYNCGLKENFGINIMFLVRNKESIKISKDTIVQEDDALIVFGPYLSIKKVFVTD